MRQLFREELSAAENPSCSSHLNWRANTSPGKITNKLTDLESLARARTCEIQHLASAGAPNNYYIRDRVKVIRSCSSRTHRRWRKRSQGENKISSVSRPMTRIIRLKQNAPELDYSSFHGKTGTKDRTCRRSIDLGSTLI